MRSHSPARFHDLVWSSWFRINSRMVSQVKAGRLFLGGDAAHIHAPAGAQGMNTGIQDMINLGWKLAMVLKGQAPPAPKQANSTATSVTTPQTTRSCRPLASIAAAVGLSSNTAAAVRTRGFPPDEFGGQFGSAAARCGRPPRHRTPKRSC